MSGSFEARFILTTGLKGDLVVPKGTLANILSHVKSVEAKLGLVAEAYKDNPPHWRSTEPTVEISDDELGRVAIDHDEFLAWLWKYLGKWSAEPFSGGESEALTEADAATFWHALVPIDVPYARWSRDYYRAQMEKVYRLLRGKPVEGIDFGADPLSIEQAASVIWVIDEVLGLDTHDQRLDAPKAWEWNTDKHALELVQQDYIDPSSSWNGNGYEWCEKCGAVADDSYGGMFRCPQKACPVKEALGQEDEEDEEDGDEQDPEAAASDPQPLEDGSSCQQFDCGGSYEMKPDGDCTCHLNPPCPACVPGILVCSRCSDEATPGALPEQ